MTAGSAACRLRGLPAPPIGALDELDVARELAYETVTNALCYFRDKVLMGRRWDPARGATIKTYFIGQCLFQFANVYRAWLKHEAPLAAVLVDDVALLDRPQGRTPLTDPAELAAIRAEIDARFNAVPEKSREKVCTVMVLTAADWTQEEIAAYMGVTVKVVERTLAYYRSLNRRKAA